MNTEEIHASHACTAPVEIWPCIARDGFQRRHVFVLASVAQPSVSNCADSRVFPLLVATPLANRLSVPELLRARHLSSRRLAAFQPHLLSALRNPEPEKRRVRRRTRGGEKSRGFLSYFFFSVFFSRLFREISSYRLYIAPFLESLSICYLLDRCDCLHQFYLF